MTTSAHWTPIAGWHDCPAPVVTTRHDDGFTITRPGCTADEDATTSERTRR